MSLCGRVAVITGGARGLGKAYAEALLERQAKVVLGDVLESEGQATAEEFNTKYGRDVALYVYSDVTKQDSVDALYTQAMEKHSRVDIVINNAGVGSAGYKGQLDSIMDINFNGVVRSCNAALKVMSKENGGRGGIIVNISSNKGLFVIPGGSLYHASKHAVVGYTKSLALMTPASSGVRIQCLCPSYVKTDLTQYLQDRENNGDTSVTEHIGAVGGWTNIEDVVAACMTLVEKDLSSGALVLADGTGTYYVERELRKTPFP